VCCVLILSSGCTASAFSKGGASASPHIHTKQESITTPASSSSLNPPKSLTSTPVRDRHQRKWSTMAHLAKQESGNDSDDTSQSEISEQQQPSLTSTADITTSQSAPDETGGAANENFRQQRRIKIAAGLILSIAAMATAAKLGILPGPLLEPGRYGEYTNIMIARDSISTAVAAVLAVALVKSITYGYEQGWYNSKIGRKLNHTLAAPLFIAFFPAFSNAEGARFFAGLVTFSNILRLYLAGTGQGDSTLAQTISRSGDKKEVLGGPFIYVCLFHGFIWLFWRSSFVGVIAISTMAAGDGMADLVGRKWGANNKWSWSDGSKSKVGTLAFGLSAFLVSFGLASWLIATGCLDSTLATSDLAARLLLISFVTAFVELLPFGDDNYTVPGCAAIMSALLLH
jgi:dolichol kinase